MDLEEIQKICPECNSGYFVVRNSFVDEIEKVRIRYYACSICGYRPADNKVVIPLRFAPQTRKRNAS